MLFPVLVQREDKDSNAITINKAVTSPSTEGAGLLCSGGRLDRFTYNAPTRDRNIARSTGCSLRARPRLPAGDHYHPMDSSDIVDRSSIGAVHFAAGRDFRATRRRHSRAGGHRQGASCQPSPPGRGRRSAARAPPTAMMRMRPFRGLTSGARPDRSTTAPPRQRQHPVCPAPACVGDLAMAYADPARRRYCCSPVWRITFHGRLNTSLTTACRHGHEDSLDLLTVSSPLRLPQTCAGTRYRHAGENSAPHLCQGHGTRRCIRRAASADARPGSRASRWSH